MPWLLLLATLLFAFAPRLQKFSADHSLGAHSKSVSLGILLSVVTYGGYFNGGLGIVMLAAFALQGYTNLHGMNGLKNLLASILSVFSVVTFVVVDLIEWEAALPMAAANICGAYITSRVARRKIRMDVLRVIIVAIGATLALAFFLGV